MSERENYCIKHDIILTNERYHNCHDCENICKTYEVLLLHDDRDPDILMSDLVLKYRKNKLRVKKLNRILE